MILPHDVARCLGHGAGASGHQNRADCVNCARRLAPRPSGFTTYIEAPKEFPCPMRLSDRHIQGDVSIEAGGIDR
jgi:hypothetical protein